MSSHPVVYTRCIHMIFLLIIVSRGDVWEPTFIIMAVKSEIVFLGTNENLICPGRCDQALSTTCVCTQRTAEIIVANVVSA